MNRTLRDEARGQAAAKAARSAGASAVTAAIAQINATFGPAWVVNRRKLAVDQVIRMGAAHPEVQARYAGRARASGARTLTDALADVEIWRAAELQRPQPSRLSLQVLDELRLILRLLRFRGLAWTYPIVASVVIADGAKIKRVA